MSEQRGVVTVCLPFSLRAHAAQARSWGRVELIYDVAEGWQDALPLRARLRRAARRDLSRDALRARARASATVAGRAHGEFMLFLFDELEAPQRWLQHVVAKFRSNAALGIVAPMHARAAGTPRTPRCLWAPGDDEIVHAPRNARASRDDVLLPPFVVRTALFRALRGFDPTQDDERHMAFDLCLRARALGFGVDVVSSVAVRTPTVTKHPAGFAQRWLEDTAQAVRPARVSTRARASTSRVVAYTAITKRYDELREASKAIRTGSDWVAFLDDETRAATTTSAWRLRGLAASSDDPNRTAKLVKILPHRFFPSHEYSLWIDGSVECVMPFRLQRLVELFLRDVDVCVFRHPIRGCAYQEARVCVQRGLDDPAIIRAQMRRYRRAQFPRDAGLVEATVLLRRHTKQVETFNEIWWEEIERGSRRDQLSIMYAAQRAGLAFGYFPLSIRAPNGLFRRHAHAGARS